MKTVKAIKNKKVSISQYAVLCGVTKTVIYTRISAGEVKTTKEKGFSGSVIDIVKYPPIGKKKNGRKPYAGK